MKKGVVVLFLFISAISLATSHQPRFVMDFKDNSAVNPINITNPEISQAFYANLSGKPGYYSIISSTPFLLYLNILSPDVNNTGKNFSAEVYVNNVSVALLNGSSLEWKRFYEEYAGDWYWAGPEFEHEMTAGNYSIKVYSPDNSGRYALAVGKTEQFPLSEGLKFIILLPKLKTRFFDKDFFSVFEGLIMKYVTAGFFLFVIFVFFIVFLVRGIARRVRINRETKDKKFKLPTSYQRY